MRTFNYQKSHTLYQGRICIVLFNIPTKKSRQILKFHSAFRSEQYQSVNDNQGKNALTQRPFVFDGIRKKSGTAEEKWNPSFGHLPRPHYFNKIEQISVERTHSANITFFHVFFFHIRLNKSCCHFRIINYIFFN